MAKTYTNAITDSEVSIAIEHLLVKTYVSTYTHVATPTNAESMSDSSWTHLGAVVEDSPSLTIRREKFQLKTGIPKALQKEMIMSVDGEFTISLYAKSNDVVRYALGVDAPVSISTIGTRLPFGTTAINKFHLLGIADFVDGSQVQHYFPEVTVKPEYTENIKPDDVGKITLGFDAYASNTGVASWHSDELIVGERYYFTWGTTWLYG